MKKPIKELFHPESFPPDPPLPDDPLQEPVEVKDGRRVIAAMRGVGPVKATSLYRAIERWNRKYRNAEGLEPSVSQMLFWASCWDPELYGIPKVKGWAKGMRRNVRRELGLEDGFDLRVMATDALAGELGRGIREGKEAA